MPYHVNQVRFVLMYASFVYFTHRLHVYLKKLALNVFIVFGVFRIYLVWKNDLTRVFDTFMEISTSRLLQA